MRVFLLRKGEGKEGTYKLTAKERNYLFRVLRLKVNDVFTAKDGEEVFYRAFLFDEDTITLERTDSPEETLLDGLSSYTGPFVPLDAFIAVLKGKKNEMQVRALTEIGVSRIILMESEFTQSPLSDHQKERLESIIREAVQQSGGKSPELLGPVTFQQALQMARGRLLILHQSTIERTESLSEALDGLDTDSHVSIMIGPEGGFSEKECSLAVSQGATPVLLSTNILRAETAAIYTAAAVQAILQN